MVVLADEVLESFFETDLSASFRLDPVPDLELPPASSGFLGDLWSNIATQDNKKMFHKLSDELGKTIGKHQVCQVARYDFRPVDMNIALADHLPPRNRAIHKTEGTDSTGIADFTISHSATLR